MAMLNNQRVDSQNWKGGTHKIPSFQYERPARATNTSTGSHRLKRDKDYGNHENQQKIYMYIYIIIYVHYTMDNFQ